MSLMMHFYILISIFSHPIWAMSMMSIGKVPSRYEGDGKQILEEVKYQHDGLLLLVLAMKDG